MFAPGNHTESQVLVGYLADQLDAIRTAAHGLTEEQARHRPCRSALSVGGVVKHATYVVRGRTGGAHERVVDEAGYAEFSDSFALRDDEALEGVLAAFDTARDAFLAHARTVDPGAATTEPAAPWDGRHQPSPSVERYWMVHLVEELARHAGHADLLREQLDGAQAGPLAMAAAGDPGNDFVQPWQPA